MAEEKNTKAEKRGRKFPLLPLLMALFLSFTFSSGLLGFQLGKNAARSGGELVDTIVLSPGDTPLRAEGTLHFLAGRLKDENGQPWAGVTVSLEDHRRSDVTNEQGKFYLSDVRSGEHTLEVTNEEGELLSSTKLVLDFNAEVNVTSDFSGEAPTFVMPEETRILELTFTASGGTTIAVEETSACFVTKDGQIVNFNGGALQVKEPSYAVTPAGNLVGSSGYVTLVSENTVITPQGGQVQPEPGMQIAPGATVGEDNSIQLEEQVIVQPDGTVELPGGEEIGGDDKVVLIEGAAVETMEVEELPDEYRPVVMIPAELPSGGNTSVQEETSDPEEKEPEEPETVYTGLRITDEYGAVWHQESLVNLFARRDTKSVQTKEIRTAQPGDSGYYDFCLENPEEFDIVYTLAIKELKFHLPIRYSVYDMDTYEIFFFEQNPGSVIGETISTPEILIPSGTSQNFRIEWNWEYEGWFDPERDDAYDTMAASSNDNIYEVAVYIRAEEVVHVNWDDLDGELKYPGVHGNMDSISHRLDK